MVMQIKLIVVVVVVITLHSEGKSLPNLCNHFYQLDGHGSVFEQKKQKVK